MIGNVFRSCIRFIRFNKLFVTLNIIGLSIGISACWITYRIVEYEFSIDKNYPDADRVFQLVTISKSNGSENGTGAVSTAALPVLQNQVSGVEKVVPIYQNNYNSLKIFSGNKIQFQKDDNLEFCNTLASYFDMIPYRWLAGDKHTALSSREKTVITEKRAKEYFPQLTAEEVIGKTLIYNDSIHKVISGVIANLQLSSFSMDEFHLLSEEEIDADDWGTLMSNNMLFLKVQPGVRIGQVVNQVNKIYKNKNREAFEKYHYNSFISPVPVEEMHFRTDYDSPIRKADRNVVTGLAAVAVFILLLACINYINISTAQLPQRAKEIGIRKTMGSSSSQLIWRFVAETALITSIAAILSLPLSRWGIQQLSDFMPAGMTDYLNYPRMIFFILILIAGISLLSGLYPALLSSKVNTVEVLKGQTAKSTGQYSISLRKALIVFQFFIAQVFIVAAFIVGQQLHFMLTKDLGFDKEAVLTIDVPYHITMDSLHSNRKQILLQKLRRNPAILNASLGDRPMENSMSATVVYSKTPLGITRGQLNLKYADSGYVGVYKFRLLSGRNISASDTVKEYLINEAAVKEFGFSTPENAVGKLLYNDYGGTAFPIVGVVQDYHQFGFHNPIAPAAIIASNERARFNVRLRAGDGQHWNATINWVKKEWAKLYPETPFDYKFYDETIAQIIEPDTRMATIINLGTGIAILISCLGLFSLATLVSFQRSKEIGIRKVLGASVPGIVQMLAKDFVQLVLLSVVIATPVAWWAMQIWLRDFAFAVRIEWWMFLITGMIALLIGLLTVSFQSVKAAMANPANILKSE